MEQFLNKLKNLLLIQDIHGAFDLIEENDEILGNDKEIFEPIIKEYRKQVEDLESGATNNAKFQGYQISALTTFSGLINLLELDCSNAYHLRNNRKIELLAYAPFMFEHTNVPFNSYAIYLIKQIFIEIADKVEEEELKQEVFINKVKSDIFEFVMLADEIAVRLLENGDESEREDPFLTVYALDEAFKTWCPKYPYC